MSLTLIPRSKPKPFRKHRLASRPELKRLLRDQQEQTSQAFGQLIGAGDTIATLQHQLADVRAKRAEAEQVVICLAADLDERTAERDQALTEVERLRAELAPYKAAEANANAITVPPAERDTTAFEDQATAPIDVRELRNRFAAGPVVSLHHSPQAADPTHIPAPAA
ncbi:hypothetical protein ABZ154_15220 [Streptomyces sp. NPDC006261]|uniref:hypothetical protein n=1 Tax=Streptomyces sp. NPDC006261 TaxID=3156739 RepID=UPI0033B28547